MMSPELIGIIAVGIALAGLFWRMLHSLDFAPKHPVWTSSSPT